MAKQSEANPRRWPIDFHFGWMVARAFQTFFVVGSLHNAYLARKSSDVFDLVFSLIL